MTVQRISKSTLKNIPLDLIDRPMIIAREEIDAVEIEELANSIRERGLLQPIVVVERSGRYEIVAGDRRYLACRKLGLESISAIVRHGSEVEVIIDRAVENIQRADLTGLEEARIYDKLVNEKGMAIDEVAKMVGKSPGTVMRRLDILKMPEPFQRAVHKKQIGVTVAEELMRCPDGAHRNYLLEMAVAHGVTKDVARLWVDEFIKGLRTAEGASEERRGVQGPAVREPVYFACGLCQGPVEILEAVELRICQACLEQLETVLGIKKGS